MRVKNNLRPFRLSHTLFRSEPIFLANYFLDVKNDRIRSRSFICRQKHRVTCPDSSFTTQIRSQAPSCLRNQLQTPRSFLLVVFLARIPVSKYAPPIDRSINSNQHDHRATDSGRSCKSIDTKYRRLKKNIINDPCNMEQEETSARNSIIAANCSRKKGQSDGNYFTIVNRPRGS